MSIEREAEALSAALTWGIAGLVTVGGAFIAFLAYRAKHPAPAAAPAAAQAAYASDSRFHIEQHKLEMSGMGYVGSHHVYVITDKLTGRSYLSVYNMRLTEIEPSKECTP